MYQSGWTRICCSNKPPQTSVTYNNKGLFFTPVAGASCVGCGSTYSNFILDPKPLVVMGAEGKECLAKSVVTLTASALK